MASLAATLPNIVGHWYLHCPAHTDLAAAFMFGSKELGQISGGSQFLVGLAAASSISIVYQFIKAVDTKQNAAVPPLQLPGQAKQPISPAASTGDLKGAEA
jgi:hypothetical protein